MKITKVPPGCMITYSGILLDLFNPTPDMFTIEDIAIGLSREFRFGNQTVEPYSVAQHSILVTALVHPKLALEALLHDASEAYIKDIPAPLKSAMLGYKEVEHNIMKAIASKFRVTYPFNKLVKTADEQALNLEWDMLIVERKQNQCWGTYMAKNRFLARYDQIIAMKNEGHPEPTPKYHKLWAPPSALSVK